MQGTDSYDEVLGGDPTSGDVLKSVPRYRLVTNFRLPVFLGHLHPRLNAVCDDADSRDPVCGNVDRR